jgi:hypothetical protein
MVVTRTKKYELRQLRKKTKSRVMKGGSNAHGTKLTKTDAKAARREKKAEFANFLRSHTHTTTSPPNISLTKRSGRSATYNLQTTPTNLPNKAKKNAAQLYSRILRYKHAGNIPTLSPRRYGGIFGSRLTQNELNERRNKMREKMKTNYGITLDNKLTPTSLAKKNLGPKQAWVAPAESYTGDGSVASRAESVASSASRVSSASSAASSVASSVNSAAGELGRKDSVQSVDNDALFRSAKSAAERVNNAHTKIKQFIKNSIVFENPEGKTLRSVSLIENAKELLIFISKNNTQIQQEDLDKIVNALESRKNMITRKDNTQTPDDITNLGLITELINQYNQLSKPGNVIYSTLAKTSPNQPKLTLNNNISSELPENHPLRKISKIVTRSDLQEYELELFNQLSTKRKKTEAETAKIRLKNILGNDHEFPKNLTPEQILRIDYDVEYLKLIANSEFAEKEGKEEIKSVNEILKNKIIARLEELTAKNSIATPIIYTNVSVTPRTNSSLLPPVKSKNANSSRTSSTASRASSASSAPEQNVKFRTKETNDALAIMREMLNNEAPQFYIKRNAGQQHPLNALLNETVKYKPTDALLPPAFNIKTGKIFKPTMDTLFAKGVSKIFKEMFINLTTQDRIDLIRGLLNQQPESTVDESAPVAPARAPAPAPAAPAATAASRRTSSASASAPAQAPANAPAPAPAARRTSEARTSAPAATAASPAASRRTSSASASASAPAPAPANATPAEAKAPIYAIVSKPPEFLKNTLDFTATKTFAQYLNNSSTGVKGVNQENKTKPRGALLLKYLDLPSNVRETEGPILNPGLIDYVRYMTPDNKTNFINYLRKKYQPQLPPRRSNTAAQLVASSVLAGQGGVAPPPLSRKLTKSNEQPPALNAANAPKYIALLKEKIKKFNAGTQEEIRNEAQMKYFMNLLNEDPSAAIKQLQENPAGFGSTINVLLNPP